MNVGLERIMVTLVIVSLAFTSLNLLGAQGTPITKEEAIEISKRSTLVQEGLVESRYTILETSYYNSQRIEQLKEWHSDEIFENVPKDAFWEEKVPEGHSVWKILWYFSGGIGGYSVIVIVDAEVGTMIHEAKGIKFL